MRQKKSGRNPMLMPYVENEIDYIVRKIEALQGTNHIGLTI